MERSIGNLKALTLSASAALFLCTAGCTSLVGKEYRYGERNADGKLDGVPFTMNKPVPTVTHVVAADTGKESFQVTFAHVADSTKRYMLQISPSLLASVDFAMTFDAAGSLTEVTAKSGDQTGALIASIGKLAVLAAADTSDQYEKDVVNKYLEFGDRLAPSRLPPSRWAEIRNELKELGPKRIKAEFVYTTSQELYFFKELLQELRRRVPRDREADGSRGLTPNKGVQDFWKQAGAHGANDSDFAKKVGDAFVVGDVNALNEMRTEQVAALQSARAARMSTQSNDALHRMKQAQARINLLKAAIQGMPGEIKLAYDIAEMSLAEWQKRTVAPLTKEIEAKQQLLRVAEASQQPRQHVDYLKNSIKELSLRKASVLGVLREVKRRDELTELLTSTNAVKDLKALREERDALDVAIAAAEPSKAKPKVPKVDEPSVAPYLVELPAGPAIGAGEVVNMLPAGERPRYVVVVKSLERSNDPAAPVAAVPAPAKPAAPSPGADGDLPSPAAPPVPPVKPAKEK